MQDIYAVGFNALGQLNGGSYDIHEPNDRDIHKFRLFSRVYGLRHIWASHTVVFTFSARFGWQAEGYNEPWQQSDHGLQTVTPLSGTTNAGVIAVYDKSTELLHTYTDHNKFMRREVANSVGGLGNIIQVVAYDTGHVALNDQGSVWTWGDSRYPACLGREIDDENPAEFPRVVADLNGLPTGKIVKIAAGGFLLMALTEGNDLYAWGGRPGAVPVLGELSSTPVPVVVNDHDVKDFAVGESHAMIVTTRGELYAIGNNANGQLGLPDETHVRAWTKVPFVAEDGVDVVDRVFCGPRNTWISCDRYDLG